jgi:hypothetical protein
LPPTFTRAHVIHYRSSSTPAAIAAAFEGGGCEQVQTKWGCGATATFETAVFCYRPTFPKNPEPRPKIQDFLKFVFFVGPWKSSPKSSQISNPTFLMQGLFFWDLVLGSMRLGVSLSHLGPVWQTKHAKALKTRTHLWMW